MGNLGDEKQGTRNDEGRKSDDVWYWVGGAGCVDLSIGRAVC